MLNTIAYGIGFWQEPVAWKVSDRPLGFQEDGPGVDTLRTV